jgi:glycine cleavage system H protein
MDGFTYHDIFQTKGIEYLIIIAFLLLIIPFWVIINKRAKIAGSLRKAFGILTIDVLKIPGGLFFSKNHTWAHLEKSGTAKVGLDDLLLHITGEVKVRCLKNPEEMISKGDFLAEMDQQGKLLKIVSPISGKILGINPIIDEYPGILNEDPYGDGWMYKIQPSDWVEETKTCYLAEDAVRWSTKELERFKDFMSLSIVKHSPEPSMVILQDGGELSDRALSGMPGDIWQDFQKEFLDHNL